MKSFAADMEIKSEDFDMPKWASDHELDEDTIGVLQDAKLTSSAALSTLTCDDVATLKLPLGQHNLLLHALGVRSSQTKSSSAANSSSQQQVGASTKSLAADKDLTQLAKALQETSLKDLLCIEEAQDRSQDKRTVTPSREVRTKHCSYRTLSRNPEGSLKRTRTCLVSRLRVAQT